MKIGYVKSTRDAERSILKDTIRNTAKDAIRNTAQDVIRNIERDMMRSTEGYVLRKKEKKFVESKWKIIVTGWIEQMQAGSLTVEAVFIVPLVLFVFCVILSIGFYMHQQVWFTAAAYEAAFSEGQEAQKAERLLAEAPLTLGMPEASATTEKHKATVTYAGSAFSLWIVNAWEYRVQATIVRQEPVTHIRNIKLLKDLVKGE